MTPHLINYEPIFSNTLHKTGQVANGQTVRAYQTAYCGNRIRLHTSASVVIHNPSSGYLMFYNRYTTVVLTTNVHTYSSRLTSRMILRTFQAQYHCGRESEWVRERERERERSNRSKPIANYGMQKEYLGNGQTKAKAPNWIVASTPTLTSSPPPFHQWLLLITRGILSNYHGIPIPNYNGLTHLCPPDDVCRELGISSAPPSPARPSSFLRTSAVSFMCVCTCSVW